jgi:hypothetical protein
MSDLFCFLNFLTLYKVLLIRTQMRAMLETVMLSFSIPMKAFLISREFLHESGGGLCDFHELFLYSLAFAYSWSSSTGLGNPCWSGITIEHPAMNERSVWINPK